VPVLATRQDELFFQETNAGRSIRELAGRELAGSYLLANHFSESKTQILRSVSRKPDKCFPAPNSATIHNSQFPIASHRQSP
jgi:hypothetical protein